MEPHKPSAPDGVRLYAVGDIHGRLDLLDRLLATIETNAAAHSKKTKKLIFLGDYVDRGIDSRGVLERLSGSFAHGLEPIFLRGNHDDLMLQFLKGRLTLAPSWLQWGGAATVASYGLNPYIGANGKSLADLRHELKERAGSKHIDFLENTVFSVTYGDYYFVHAGVREGVPLEKQKPEDQMWSRDGFMTSTANYGKVIVHGHTIRPEPERRANRIGIDTGAFATGHLTCLILDGEGQKILQT